MPGAIELTVTFPNGEVEFYTSLSKCAQKYKLSLPTMQLVTGGYHVDDMPFPKGTKFELKRRTSENMEGKWYCKACQKSMLFTSKSGHVKSKKHMSRTTPTQVVSLGLRSLD